MSLHPEISKVLSNISPLRGELLEHPVYAQLESLPHLRRFMELHVFAVWDFMSLLKALQRKICCVDVPWLPSKYQSSTRFINEIVLAEESDDNGQGGYASHFEMYLRSMEECGADTTAIQQFLEHLSLGATVTEALQSARVPAPAAQFVTTTFEIIDSGDLSAIASAFTFGREGLLPDLFAQIVRRLQANHSRELSSFVYYLQRHIELDSAEHGPLADRLLVTLCQDDPLLWQTVESTAYRTLQARKILWDGMLDPFQAPDLEDVSVLEMLA